MPQTAFSETESALFNQSLEFYNQKNYAASSEILFQLIRKNPRKSLYWFNLGNCAFMDGQYDKAKLYFKKVTTLKSPLSPAAKLYQAKSLSKLGQQKEAESLLQQLLQENPPSGIFQEAQKDLNLAVSKNKLDAAWTAYQEARYEDAEKNLRKLGDQISTDGRLLLGLSLAKQNKKVQAESVLKGLLLDSSHSAEISEENRATARQLLENLHRQKNPYWLVLDSSYGRANNIYLEGRSLTPISSAFWRGEVELGSFFHQNRPWSQKGIYAYSAETPQSASDLKTQTHVAMLPLLFQDEGWEFVLNPYFQMQIWDRTWVSQKSALSLDLARRIRIHSVGLEIHGEEQQSRSSDYNYLSGRSSSVRPYYQWAAAFSAVQIQWVWGKDGTQDLSFADGSLLPMTHFYQGPGLRFQWSPSDSWLLVLIFNRLQKSYLHGALPGGKMRRDTETEISLKFFYSLSSEWKIYGLIESLHNSSSLGADDIRDKNYTATMSSLGLNWQVF